MAIVGEAYVVVRAMTSGFESDVKRAFSGINKDFDSAGRDAGTKFASGIKKSGAKQALSGIEAAAFRAKESFASLVTTGYFVGPALAGLVGAIGSLAAGFVALASQVSAALPSLVVLPSVFSALGQAALTGKLAFSGLGKAIGALGKQTTGGGGVDRMPSLLQAMASAQERVNSANKNLEKSQKALNESYRIAAERIQQLNFDTEDAALAEQRAAIALAEARAELALVQDLPPNSTIRREAELAYQEADLNYRRSKDRTSDLLEEQDKVTKNGTLSATQQIEQSDEVVSAKEAEANAIIELKKAIDEQIKAQRELFSGGSGGGGAAANPLEGLSAEAQSFAQFIVDLKPKINELKAAAGQELFPQLEDAIANLVDNLFPALIPILKDTGKALGGAATDFSNIFTEADNLKNINAVAKTNTDTIGKFGVVAGNLATTFFDILAAADPLVRRFTDWIVVVTEGWKNSELLNNEGGRLTEVFNKAGDTAAQLGRIFGNIGRALMDIGRAAAGPGSGGQMLLDSFENATKKFEEFVTKLSEDGRLQQYFRDIVPNVEAIGRFLVNIVEEVMKLGDNKGIAGLADGLTRAVDAFGGMGDRLLEGAPALGEFVANVSEFLGLFTESESIQFFFATLNIAMEALNAVFSNDLVQRAFLLLAPIFGIYKAVRLLNIVFAAAKLVGRGYFDAAKKGFNTVRTFAKKAAAGQLLDGARLRIMYAKEAAAKGLAAAKVGLLTAKTKIASAATKVWTGLQAAFNAVMAINPITLIIIAIVALIAIVIILYFKFKWFRDFVQKVWEGIKIAAEAVFNAIKAAIEFLWNNVIKPVFGFIIAYFKFGWGLIFGIFSAVWDGIKGAISGIVDVFKFVWDTVYGVVSGAIGAIGDVIGGIIDVVDGVADGIWNAFKGAFNFVADLWNNTIGKLSFRIPGWVPGIGGKGFDVPDIPKFNTSPSIARGAGASATQFNQMFALANGGIVYPRAGGVPAIIAEAGRAERVEPLDPSGLSKRDRAMIAMLSGGGGGQTVNVYPSKGMSEVELAAQVSRQMTRMFRKGGI